MPFNNRTSSGSFYDVVDEVKAYYAKVPAARDAVVPPWTDRLAGHTGTDEALARIVAAA